ncbi:MAG: HMA2 domain-containing protein [Bilophila wadsworthia]
MLFFIVHDVPGRVRLRARYGFSLRKAQVLADRLDAVGGIEGVSVNPRTGSVLLLYANDEAKRAAFLLLAVVASEQPSGDVAVCGENLPEPAGRPSWGLFSAISLSGRSCRFSSGWPRRWRPPFLYPQRLRRCAVGASVWMSLMPPPSAFPCYAVTSKRHAC